MGYQLNSLARSADATAAKLAADAALAEEAAKCKTIIQNTIAAAKKEAHIAESSLRRELQEAQKAVEKLKSRLARYEEPPSALPRSILNIFTFGRVKALSPWLTPSAYHIGSNTSHARLCVVHRAAHLAKQPASAPAAQADNQPPKDPALKKAAKRVPRKGAPSAPAPAGTGRSPADNPDPEEVQVCSYGPYCKCLGSVVHKKHAAGRIRSINSLLMQAVDLVCFLSYKAALLCSALHDLDWLQA